jgi:hypothetical protein
VITPRLGLNFTSDPSDSSASAYQQPTLTGMTVAAKAWNNPTNHGGGIFTGFDQQGGDQCAGGCFSVTPRYSNRGLLIDQGSQEIRSMPDRQLMRAGVF